MQGFRRELDSRLEAHGAGDAGPSRRWLFVPYDQLSDEIGPLAVEDPSELGIVLVESPWKARRRPYHKRKLALLLTNLRHFALEQADRGVAVRHVVHDGPYRDALAPLAEDLGTLRCMEPAERELRIDLAPLVEKGLIEILPHEAWLTTREQFEDCGPPPWRMDRFYRRVRTDLSVLMDGKRPRGAKWSHDAENRKPWKGEPSAPTFPTFEVDAIKREVASMLEARFAEHPGAVDVDTLPATKADAHALWSWAKESCLEHFGPYEDAMTTESTVLFHTRISALLHLCRLLPRDCMRDVLALDIPLNSKEGFVRQLLGWREFMHWTHVVTDGFRELPGAVDSTSERVAIGDGGWARWAGRPWPYDAVGDLLGDDDDSVRPAALESHREAIGLPTAFWDGDSGLRCLDHVVREVWDSGYGHHITRLMVLSNLATLLGVDARELCDWFWVAYEDAYDWVVEPNVLGMGTFALGELFTTKPYVSGSAYIHRMGDYCADCSFDPKKDCPITRFYWAFLAKNSASLEGNPRVAMPLRSLAKRDAATKDEDDAVRRAWQDRLAPSS